MTSRRINTSSLEFDQIKQNLKEFLKGQSQFSDYDFDGSNMSVLLDVLAFNTHYNALYTNMALNEVYLDSASRRDSVVSLAAGLGYTPRSHRSARVVVDFVLAGVVDPPSFVTLPKGTPFYGTKDSVRYTFYTLQDYTAPINASNEYTFEGIELFEGSIVNTSFEYTEKNAFEIPNSNIDTSTLTVRIQDNPTSTNFRVFSLSTDISTVDADSNVYFMRETGNETYQISFGDGNFGVALVTGNVINVEYVVCSGEDPNGVRTISYAGGAILGGSVEALTVKQSAAGGRFPETTDEIRFNAPNYYSTQNRAVTSTDYEAIILSKVPAIEEVAVWGGENNYPPVYGKVFISAKTASGRDLTYAEQQDIVNYTLNQYKVVSVIPEFVSPAYIEVEANIVAYYDPALTTKQANTIKSEIIATVENYNDTNLGKFNKILRRSVLSRIVENVDQSIISCVPRLKMRRTIDPVYGVAHNYKISVGNPFSAGTILTSGFFVDSSSKVYYIDDDGKGILRIFTVIDGIRSEERVIGSVDYSQGYFEINNLKITRLNSNQFTLAVTPSSADIASLNNQIVSMDINLLSVSVVVDETTQGRALNGNKFQFTSNNI
jgi:hypothetical protein